MLLNEFFSHVVTKALSLELLLLNKEFGPFFSRFLGTRNGWLG